MIPSERHRSILALLKEHEIISINELIERLQVSHMTIRRDISKLEADGRVLSVTGGVQLAQTLHDELSHDDKALQNHEQKELISQRAQKLITDNMVIYLDAGTTTLEIAKEIIKYQNITVVTNDFVIANFLITNANGPVYHTGGKIDRGNKSSVGPKAAQTIRQFNIDLAFISTSSWNLRGISTPMEDKVVVKQAICEVSKVSCLVSDSSKYGRVAPFHAVNIEQFDLIITDNMLPDQVFEALTNKGVSVTLV